MRKLEPESKGSLPGERWGSPEPQLNTTSVGSAQVPREPCLRGGGKSWAGRGVRPLAEAPGGEPGSCPPGPADHMHHTHQPHTQPGAEQLTGNPQGHQQGELSSAGEETTGRTSKLFKSRPVAPPSQRPTSGRRCVPDNGTAGALLTD